ncbi:energy transducer TonB [Frateuria hangzhouensis]|uniref:energy transducer TonB n=1 Tax=Frateuria hangzhouensis TaxID=2995589 RepID=UPI002260F04E|nr:energy transducer TonB [Frateuria sp. STR12]MCX7512903.1 energy transducer TonB [Frateuria sp. STR12]
MDTRSSSMRAHARGAIRPTLLAVIAIFVLLAAASWFLILQPHQELVMQDAGGHPSTPVSTSKIAVAPPANVEAMDLTQLLAEARKAMNDHRVLAPAGNNAFEFYLKALEKQPGNTVATDALRETFPFAASGAEQAINARDFSEAQREIDLLAKADPANYTLTILRSKLDAQRKLLDKEQQLALEQQRQQQLAAEKAAADKAAAEKLAAAQKTQQANQEPPAQVAATDTPASTEPAKPVVRQVVSTDPVMTKYVQPRFPTKARRTRTQGWVVVGYTVDVEGNVTGAQVVDAQPRHVFDREAIDAVERWKYKPATRNGRAVEANLQKKIEFRL